MKKIKKLKYFCKKTKKKEMKEKIVIEKSVEINRKINEHTHIDQLIECFVLNMDHVP